MAVTEKQPRPVQYSTVECLTVHVMFSGLFDVSTQSLDLVDRSETISLPWYRGWDVFVCISREIGVTKARWAAIIQLS